MSPRALATLGWIGTATSVAMYTAQIDPILRNLAGDKGSIVQPAATAVNATLWCAYALLKPHRDWPIFVANAPGVVLGLVAFATAI